MNMKFISVMAVLAATSALAGCQTGGEAFPGLTSKSPARKVIAQQAEIRTLNPILACVRPVVAGKRFAIPQSVDNTGKGNSVSDAGTGNFLPGNQTAGAAIPTIQAAGGKVMDLENINGESVLRQLVPNGTLNRMKAKTASNMPDYYVNYASLSLDFDRTSTFNGMFKGLGFYHDMQRATISGGAKLVRADGSLQVDGYGGVKLSVYSTQGGFLIGRIIDKGIASGEAGVGIQQPMQLWTTEYLTALTTTKAMTQLPGASPRCRAMFDKVVQPDPVDL